MVDRVRATGRITIKCADCHEPAEVDIGALELNPMTCGGVEDVQKYECLTEIVCTRCQARIPFHLVAQRPVSGGDATFSLNKPAYSAPLAIIGLSLHDL